jgi:hypothetical protein
MQQAAQEYEQRAAALRCEWESEKAQLARQQQREVEAVRQQYEVNQVGGSVYCLHRLILPGSLKQASGATLQPCSATCPLISISCCCPCKQEAWRAAASERARREMEAREAAVRRQLAAERDDEVAAVVGRLEEDALAKEAQLQACRTPAFCAR